MQLDAAHREARESDSAATPYRCEPGRAASAQGAPRAATGPVRGFPAAESTAGTETGSKIGGTPASIPVVGRDQIRGTGARSIAEAKRPTAGVFSPTSGFDPRYDLFQTRGVGADETGHDLDGLQPLSCASEALRGGALDAGAARHPARAGRRAESGGLVDAIAKRPTAVPCRRVEVRVNDHGDACAAFALSGPVAAWSPRCHRVTGLGRAGDTQVDHIDDDRGDVPAALSSGRTARRT